MPRPKAPKRRAATRTKRAAKPAGATRSELSPARRAALITKLEKLAPEHPMQHERAARLLARAPRNPPPGAGTLSGDPKGERVLAYLRSLAPANPDEQRDSLTKRARRFAAKQPPPGVATPE